MDNMEKMLLLKRKAEKKKLKTEDLVNYISVEKRISTLEETAPFLIDELIKIKHQEESAVNNELTHKFTSFAQLNGKYENGKLGENTYFIDNSNSETYVLGDLHGDSLTLLHFIERVDFIEKVQSDVKINFVFLGDYVDRGHKMFKTLELVMLLKYLFPKNIFLLRGNHDGGTVISEDEYKLCVGRNIGTTDDDYFTAFLFNKLTEHGNNKSLLRKYHAFFDSLAHLAVIYDEDKIYFLTHGGIPRPKKTDKYGHLKFISDLNSSAEEVLDFKGDTPAFNMTWSDPAEYAEADLGKRRFSFYREDFDAFCEKFGIDMLIRGHEAFENGYKEFFDGKLITVFTSGKFSEEENLESAYNDVKPCIYGIKNGKGIVIR